MSGRRLREAVKSEFDSHGTPKMNVVIAGLCNVYTHYITTYEEYQNTTQDLPRGPEPPLFNIGNLTLLPSLGAEKAPANKAFGDVLQEVRHQYRATEHNFLTVERYTNTSGSWHAVQNGASWDTRFYWTKGSLGRSNVTIEWHVPPGTELGTYRVRYFGHYKKRIQVIHTITVPFEGSSGAFEITGS
ncbi:putative inactive neutral ceramidase B [Willisornis vidua]|uniref:Neutral ceramidase n=1 Tax=Willisornis vidua TaxID=1566151 RepID=A0ABQ9DP08_9PASS|nr:putative inactive neutral ceramidase B [Willisornis vidua]